MNLSYFHEKLSLAIFEMCTSTQNRKERLRNALLKYPFKDFPVGMAPKEARQQFLEIRTALAGGLRDGSGSENYPDAIDRMKGGDLQRLFNNIFSLYQAVTKEYHRRIFQG